jgi:Zn-dependent protease with chaperone function
VASDKPLPDWGADATDGAAQRRKVIAALVGPGIVLGLVVALFLDVNRGIFVTIVYTVASLTLVWGQGLRVTGWLDARKLRASEHPRFEHLVQGLASDIGIAPPELWLIREGAPNAAVFTARGPCIAVTSSLLEQYTRTELEAVIAHCLLRIARGDVGTAMLANASWPFGHRLAPRVGYEDDVQAAAVTRFPPALAAAIEKAEPRSGRYAGLWFVATGPTHRPVPERVAALGLL